MARPSIGAARPLVALALILLSACAPSRPTDAGTATVVDVVDGDTVIVEIAGNEESIRLLGIDTPETVHPSRPVECYGPEASAFAAEVLPPGTAVRLERDTEARDQFGRLLAYIHRADDDMFVNLALVEQGYADVLIIEPNRAYAATLHQALASAKEQGLGLWSACGGVGVPLAPAGAPPGTVSP